MIDLKLLTQEHVPNVPRTRDEKGPVNEPVQCRKDLQVYPCDIKQLLDMIKELTERRG
jgi:hypothetical protein